MTKSISLEIQRGLEIIDLGFGSQLQRILIETLGEGLHRHGEGPVWLTVNSMSLWTLGLTHPSMGKC